MVTENRKWVVVDTRLTLANGRAERDAALEMMEHKPAGRRVTLGGDRNYDTHALVAGLRSLRVTPHLAENTVNRRSAIDLRTTQHEGYAVSQRKRRRVEEVFGFEAGNCAAIHFIVFPVPAVHLDDGGLVTIGILARWFRDGVPRILEVLFD